MLYVVATPIGNLDEITFRAVETLKTVDLIAAEDTRHSAILLSKYGITTKTFSYHKFNERETADGIIEKLKNGVNVALISDAGMPAISDPGRILIEEVIKNDLPFTVVSGATAAINAFVLSGFNTKSFTSLGFLPEKNIDRKNYILPYKQVPGALVFYSSVHDVKKDLAFLFSELGNRKVAICREMTKTFESVYRGNLSDDFDVVEKGEFVIVVEGNSHNALNDLTVDEHIKYYIDKGESATDAVKKVARDRGVAKNVIYKEYVAKKDEKNA